MDRGGSLDDPAVGVMPCPPRTVGEDASKPRDRPSASASVPGAPRLSRTGDPNRSGGPLSRSAVERVEAQEHLANVSRLRTVHTVAAALWVLTIACDWNATTFVTHGSIGWFLVWRATVFVLLVGEVLRLRAEPPPGYGELRALELMVHASTAASVAMMALEYKGIASPYAHAVSCVLVARAVALPDHWRQNVTWGLIPAAIYGLTLGAAALFSPTIAAQFRQPELVSEFALGVGLQFVTFVLAATGGHATWALRRRVLETRSVGRYRFKQRLGAGAMGEVWLAHHPALRRDVAVKLLKGEATAAAVQRFEREVRATADLVHPNTVRVFDYGATEDGDWYYVMEYLPGETLGSVVRRDGPMAPDRVARIALQAAGALGEAHAHGIVHRDIKPDNLMLASIGSQPDFLKVLDFGVAKVASSRGTLAPQGEITREGIMLGTPLYMSPEQGAGETIDARADLYSLGCVMYFALCGHPPFDTGNAATTILLHMTQAPPTLAERGAIVPAALDAVIARCLAKKPEDRFPDAAALAAALAPLTTTPA